MSDLRAEIQDQDGVELIVNFCHSVILVIDDRWDERRPTVLESSF